jgi:spore germination protein YaaH
MKSSKHPPTTDLTSSENALLSDTSPNLKEKHKKKKRRIEPVLYTIAATLLVLAVGFTFCFTRYYPGTQWTTIKQPGLILNDDPYTEEEYIVLDGKVYMRVESIRNTLDPSIFHEPARDRVIVTTADKVIDMNTVLLTTYVNYKPLLIQAPVFLEQDIPYVSLDFLSPLYDLQITITDSGIVILDNFKRSLLRVEVTDSFLFFKNPFAKMDFWLNRSLYLREDPSANGLRIKKLLPGDSLIVFQEENNHYKVRTTDGFLGYIHKDCVVLKEIIEKREEPILPDPPGRSPGEKINLTWDYMSRPRQDMSDYTPIQGLNVISPTWFHLLDREANLQSHGSVEYVEWAHEHGVQVWALFSNNFDPNMTSVVLRDFELRKKMIMQLIVLSDLLNIDGINIDFENVHYADRDYLTQFVRELTPMLHEQNLVVSMDVTFRSTNPNWSMVYDRPAISKVIDYMAVMAYDEHWGSSPKAGSVASLPWVENNLERILEQIPPEKVILGVPLYARVWEEKPMEDGSVKVTSNAYSMRGIQNIIRDNNASVVFEDITGQHYAEYFKNQSLYRMWIEDETSMRARIRLIHKYKLAGVASWRRGFDEPYIWDVIHEELYSR